MTTGDSYRANSAGGGRSLEFKMYTHIICSGDQVAISSSTKSIVPLSTFGRVASLLRAPVGRTVE